MYCTALVGKSERETNLESKTVEAVDCGGRAYGVYAVHIKSDGTFESLGRILIMYMCVCT